MTKNNNISKIGFNLDNSYSRLPEIFYTQVNPTPVPSPKLLVFNDTLAVSLGLDNLKDNDEIADILSGNQIPDGALPIAQAYAGHQFGHFTMLGDGRAILLGEQITPTGERFDVQLKGPGRTPYSRGGDGRAAIGPMLREYIISEAMYALGIPTTRSLAVVTTGESVYRETELQGAILTRIASSHIRVGTFQYVSRWGTYDELRELADYTIKRHYPDAKNSDNPYLFLLQEVIKRQAALIAKWQQVGFIHGVMNTDNMAISGETIDYGPCAFMDTYNPQTVFSSIDVQGRYAYGNQSYIAGWNLAKFAEAIIPLLHDNKDQAIKLAQDSISGYSDLFFKSWLAGMRAKLGIFNEETEDEEFIEDLLNLMEKYKVDYTNTFLALTFDKWDDSKLYGTRDFTKWHDLWQGRLKRQKQSQSDSQQLMKNNNPAIIPRNHRVEEALNAANQGDLSKMHKLLNVLSRPYEHSPEQEAYSMPPEPSNCHYRTFCGT